MRHKIEVDLCIVIDLNHGYQVVQLRKYPRFSQMRIFLPLLKGSTYSKNEDSFDLLGSSYGDSMDCGFIGEANICWRA